MPYDLVVGRNESDMKKYGKKGLVLLGRAYVKMGHTTSLSNYIYMDVAKGHVVYVVGKRGSGKCIKGNIPIQLEDGSLKNIEDIYIENLPKSTVKLNKKDEQILELKDSLRVMSMDNCMKLEGMPVSHIYRKKVKEDIIRIKTRSGREVTVTKEHPLFRMNGELSWTEASMIKEGDFIAIPKTINSVSTTKNISNIEKSAGCMNQNGIKKIVTANGQEMFQYQPSSRSNPITFREINPNIAELLGYMVSEGNEVVQPNSYRVMFTNYDPIKTKRFKELVRKEFSLDCHGTGNIVYFNSKGLSHYLQDIGYKIGRNSWTKEIPEFIMKDKNLLRTFLKAYIGREAYMDKKKPDIEITTTSKRLASQVAYGLLQFGVFARVIRKEKYASNTKERIKRTYNLIYISGINNLRKFINEIGLDDAKKEKRLINQLIKQSNPNFDIIPHVGKTMKYIRKNMGVACRELHHIKQVMKTYEEEKYNPTRPFLSNIIDALENKYDYLVRLCREAKKAPNPIILKTLRKELRISWKEVNKAAGAPYSVSDIFKIKKYRQGKAFQKVADYLTKKAYDIISDEKLIECLLRLRYLCKSDIYWDRITLIEKVHCSDYVYDLTVPKTHNFIAGDNGGMICHNSYTLGVIAEGMIDLPSEIRKNIAIVMLDTMGIYWTMKYPNEKDEDLLNEWGLQPKGLDVKIYTPYGFFNKYKEEGIPTDEPFSLKASELSPQDWVLTFQIDESDPAAIVLSKTIGDFQDAGKKDYDLDDMIKAIQKDKSFETRDKNSTINRLRNAKRWGLFRREGTNILDIIKGGQVSILDVSVYANMEGGWGVKNLVIGLLGQKAFINRMKVRKEEELDAIEKGYSYFQTEVESGMQEQAPIVWLILDEAHEALPKEGKTAATESLVTIMREGRQPGVCLILCTQQPGKIHTDVMSQSDIVISHRLTAKPDVEALASMSQSYLTKSLPQMIDELPREKGSALILDDNSERFFPLRVRPRFTWHGGEAPSAVPFKRELNLGLD